MTQPPSDIPLFPAHADNLVNEDDEIIDSPDAGIATLLHVLPEHSGERLDRWLAALQPETSRSRIKALILAGQVSADGATIMDPSWRVKPGQAVIITIPESVPALPEAQDIPLTILFEDEHVIVINKAPGMVVHPGAGIPDGTLVNALLHHCGSSLSGIGGIRRPGIVHRLDKDTSGLMIAAKHDRAHHRLAKQFSSRTIERAYRAVVWGTPQPTTGNISGNIGRSPHNRQKMAILRTGGKTALTRYRILTPLFEGMAALVECRLDTGRTHQIRVHMASIGHALIGDPVYGSPRRLAKQHEAAQMAISNFCRQALHAETLGFMHPANGTMMRFEAKMPADMQTLLLALGGSADFF